MVNVLITIKCVILLLIVRMAMMKVSVCQLVISNRTTCVDGTIPTIKMHCNGGVIKEKRLLMVQDQPQIIHLALEKVIATIFSVKSSILNKDSF